jgi:2'-hydroxyisoflavone reductase
MDILVLGGTAWVARELSRQAIERGHRVTCLARGKSGEVADGATLVAADRRDPSAYEPLLDRVWDAVVEVSWQPGFVRGALDALGGKAGHWVYISSGNAYTSHATPGADESAALLAPTDRSEVDRELYGEAKAACEQASMAAVGDRLLIARAGLIGGPGDHSGRSGYWGHARRTRSPWADAGPRHTGRAHPGGRRARPHLLAARLRGDGNHRHVQRCRPGRSVRRMDRAVPHRRRAHRSGRHRRIGMAALHLRGPVHGPESLAMWLVEPGLEGWSARDGAAAQAAGLRHRPRAEMLADTLRWEREQGLDRERRAGLSAQRERELLDALG